MVVVAIAVGKRRQPRGEKWWQRRGRQQLVGAGTGAAVVIAASEARFLSLSESENMHAFFFRGEGSTYTNWQQFGAIQSDASSNCPNI